MVNIICVKWGTKFDASWVNKMYSMVKRNLTIPFKMICITDNTTGIDSNIEILPIKYPELYGFWSKLAMFSPDYITGTCLYLDLDIVISRNIDSFVDYCDDETFSITRDWTRPDTEFNSSIMKFNPQYHHIIWDTFIKRKDEVNNILTRKQRQNIRFNSYKFNNSEDLIHIPFKANGVFGDQDIITAVMFNNATPFPDEWTSSWKTLNNKTAKIHVFYGSGGKRTMLTNHPIVKDNWK